MTKQKWTHKMAAIVTAGVMAGKGSEAFAGGTTFSDVAGNIVTGSSRLPDLISTVAYIGGIGLGVAGVFKLKQHVDNPGQTPMKDGLVRLGAGGGLLALPYVTTAMQGTMDAGQGTTLNVANFNGLNGFGGAG
jgi:hypothetical protein